MFAVYSYRVEFFLASKTEAFAEYANTMCNIRLANQREFRQSVLDRVAEKISIVNMKYKEHAEKFDQPPSIRYSYTLYICAYAGPVRLYELETRRRNLLVDFHSLERLRVHSWCPVYIVCRFLSRIPLHNLID